MEAGESEYEAGQPLRCSTNGVGRVVARHTVRGTAVMPVTLIPLSETHFFAKETETEIMFVKSEKGQVTGAVLRLGSCQDSKAKKIE